MKHTKLIAAFLSFSLLFGCSGAESASMNSGATDKQSSVIQISTFAGFYNNNIKDEEEKKKWEEYMSDRWNTSISVIQFENVMFQMQDNSFSGLMQLSPEVIMNYIYNEHILPLDDYLKDNKTWNSLPEHIKELYEFQGHIWAIPSEYYVHTASSPTIMSIRTDWLKNVGMTMPTTLDELFKVGKAFAQKEVTGMESTAMIICWADTASIV